MTEAEFMTASEETLRRIEMAVEQAAGVAGVDVDIETEAEGVLKLVFENATQIIVNRHVANREIWVAARSGGFHFRPEAGRWVGTRDGRELWEALAVLVSEQAGVAMNLAGQ